MKNSSGYLQANVCISYLNGIELKISHVWISDLTDFSFAPNIIWGFKAVEKLDPQPDPQPSNDPVHHPSHYGGDMPYEVVKVIEAWGLGFNDGNALKYIGRAGKKDPNKHIEDLEKAREYLRFEIERLKRIKV